MAGWQDEGGQSSTPSSFQASQGHAGQIGIESSPPPPPLPVSHLSFCFSTLLPFLSLVSIISGYLNCLITNTQPLLTLALSHFLFSTSFKSSWIIPSFLATANTLHKSVQHGNHCKQLLLLPLPYRCAVTVPSPMSMSPSPGLKTSFDTLRLLPPRLLLSVGSMYYVGLEA